ncbi:MAG: hypothetical protein COW71_04750 [Ignavibacteriales bacterium CG18_big_fil_WC_8_21_14_2_50_31_20]|nr:hypothetical protein [Ignavibacteria bacterium]PIQ09850.1 MAG: hypothetical protein COW71_04750 [Ignavibacteriales bacterium CG18_big_fil_WC_8_21_14_2_50_31_20]
MANIVQLLKSARKGKAGNGGKKVNIGMMEKWKDGIVEKVGLYHFLCKWLNAIILQFSHYI